MDTPDGHRIAIVTKIPADLEQALAQRFVLVEHRADRPALTDIDVAVTTSMAGGGAALFNSLPDLRLLTCQGVGLDRIDLAEARSRGIAVAHTPDVMTLDVADFAVGLMFAAMRNLIIADTFVRAGRWNSERLQPSVRLTGKVVGIVGLGKIGGAIAKRVEAFGMSVAWHGPRAKPGIAWPFEANVIDLAARSDVLIVTAPGGNDTDGLIGKETLAALGPSGWLVNIARGSVVDEPALLDALEERRIAGAGLDVFATEPALDARFLALPNVVLAPHYASLTHETRREMIALIVGNIDRHLAGQPLLSSAT